MRPVDQKRILVADDTLPMRIMLQDVLTEAGYDVITAADGEEAWNIVQAQGNDIDLLILDLLMPRMTGFEVLEKIKSGGNPFDLKSLVVTGIFKSEKEIKRMKDLGASGYLTKTALIDEILFRVNQVFHMGMENTRRFQRLFMSLPVEYRRNGSVYSNFSSNFSAGGVFIRTIDPLEETKEIELSFQVPEIDLDVKALGRVVWTNEYETNRRKSSLPGMGIEFLELDAKIQSALDIFVNERLVDEPVWLTT